VERLEVVTERKKPPLFRSGYLKTLPADYVGERHVVIVKREPSGATGQNEWCEFEERPGPAPLDAQEEGCTTIYIVYRDLVNPQGGQAAPGRDEV
jgi:putative transposon-encoded protein